MKNQRELIKKLFESRKGEWIPCYEIAKIALQYNSRVKELRSSGMYIQNKTQMVNGEKHSSFLYAPDGQGVFA